MKKIIAFAIVVILLGIIAFSNEIKDYIEGQATPTKTEKLFNDVKNSI